TNRATIELGGLHVELRTRLNGLENSRRRELNSLRWRMHRFSAVTHLFGPGNLLADIGSLQRADTPERVEKFAGRLSTIPTYLAAVGKVADEGAQLGQVAPALAVDRAVGQIGRLLSLAPAA